MVKPLHDRIVVEPLEEESKTAGGIYLPDTAKEKPQKGRVVAVGPGRQLEGGGTAPLSVSKGDAVLYSKYGGTEIKLNGKEYLILREDDVLAIIEEKSKTKKGGKK